MRQDDLVDLIYEAGALPQLWPRVLETIETRIRAKAAALFTLAGDAPRVTASPGGLVLAEGWFEYVGDQAADNVRTKALLESDHAGFLTDYDIIAPEALPHVPLYRDFLIPSGYGFGTATTIRFPSGDTFIVHFERAMEEGPFEKATVAELDRLRGHMARAALLSERLGFIHARAMTEALATVQLAAAAVTRTGTAIAANSLLTALMPQIVQDTPSGLKLVDPSAQALLESSLARAANGSGNAPVHSIPVPATASTPPVVVHLLPVRGAAHDIFLRAEALLVFTPLRPRGSAAANVLQGLFDLTPAEAEVARAIGLGASPGEIALRKGLKPNTVRNQVKSVFAKTGLNRQVDLVNLVRSIALADEP